MQLDKKAFGVPVESALTHLIGVHFDEGVVTAFFFHREMESAKQSGESSRARRVRVAIQGKCRKEFVGNPEYVRRRKLGTKEMPHCSDAALTV